MNKLFLCISIFVLMKNSFPILKLGELVTNYLFDFKNYPERKKIINNKLKNYEITPDAIKFKGQVLSGLDLSNMCLKGIDFSECIFVGVNFSNSDLTETNFNGALFYKNDINGSFYFNNLDN